jgi:hypothetical protein
MTWSVPCLCLYVTLVLVHTIWYAAVAVGLYAAEAAVYQVSPNDSVHGLQLQRHVPFPAHALHCMPATLHVSQQPSKHAYHATCTTTWGVSLTAAQT